MENWVNQKHGTGEMTNKPDLDGFGKQNLSKQPTSIFVQKTPDFWGFNELP